MNTVFVVKKSKYEFMVTPEEVNIDWISNVLNTQEIQTKNISDDLYIIQSVNENHNITYKMKIGKHIMNIKGNFMLLKNVENLFLPLDEHLEDYIVDSIEISKCKKINC